MEQDVMCYETYVSKTLVQAGWQRQGKHLCPWNQGQGKVSQQGRTGLLSGGGM